MVVEVGPRELAQRLRRGDKIVLLDVREPWESNIASLHDSVSIPMDELPYRVHELDPREETVVYCHLGIRSVQVIEFLRQLGFSNLLNLKGGIDAWCLEVDLTLARY